MIHKTAIVDSKAKISSSAEIGAYSIIGPKVEIGDNTIIQSHVSIVGNTKIGSKNNIYPFANSIAIHIGIVHCVVPRWAI